LAETTAGPGDNRHFAGQIKWMWHVIYG
jgi:hypothetical protein